MPTQIIDISLPLFNNMPVYPGNKITTIRMVQSKSGHSRLSEIGISSHVGTHIDAPSHVFDSKITIEKLPLKRFYGICRVLDFTTYKRYIPRRALEKARIQPKERILIKTKNSLNGFKVFNKSYVYLVPESAKYLSEKKIWLVGIDAPSIKKRGSKDNSAHEFLLSKEIPILEGLNLKAVTAGTYVLISFPLAFKGIDGSPCRAILVSPYTK